MDTNTASSAKPAESQETDGLRAGAEIAVSKVSPSVLASDLVVQGDIETAGDVAVEGTIEGNCRAHLVTVGEGATVNGELVAEDVVVHGRVIGRLRGLKVRLTASARVEGDIIHKTLAIESGAYFDGSVQRQEDPIAKTTQRAVGSQTSTAEAASKASTSDSPRESAANHAMTASK